VASLVVSQETEAMAKCFRFLNAFFRKLDVDLKVQYKNPKTCQGPHKLYQNIKKKQE